MFLRFIIGFSVSFLLPLSAYADECSNWTKQAQQAYANQQVQALQNLHNKIESSQCLAMDKTYIALNLSRLMYSNMAKNNIDGLARIDGLNAILDVMPTFWPALVDLGDDESAKGISADYDEVSAYYDRALAAINNTNITPDHFAPDSNVIQNLYAKADTAMLAATAYVPISHGGASSFKTRGINHRGKNVPIHFDFGRKTLSGSDKRHAKRLYRALSNQGSPNITLIGHTDPVGTPPRNRVLSQKRAKTVKQFLKKQGYSGNISTKGEGEDKPLADPHSKPLRHYGKKRWHRMLRRVEVRTQ